MDNNIEMHPTRTAAAAGTTWIIEVEPHMEIKLNNQN
jgi:hypothetical protein